MNPLEMNPPGNTPSKNRYLNAPRNADHTVDQDWHGYSAAEHARWDGLVARQAKILPGRACRAFIALQKQLRLSQAGIPHFGRLSERLSQLTGWRVVAVPELVPDDVFFDHLAQRRFPAGAFIRGAQQLDYIKEPDVFHDVYGHVPLLADPVYADYMQAYGEAGREAGRLGMLHYLARLYWYTVEFGLLKSPDGLRIYGAGILSSPAECVFALQDASPNRIAFDLIRVMRTNYRIDDFQQVYFVIDSFDQLHEALSGDLAPAYDRLKQLSDAAPQDILAGDGVLTRGTLAYFRKNRPCSMPHEKERAS